MTVGIPFSNQGRVSVASLVRMLKAQQNRQQETVEQVDLAQYQMAMEPTDKS
jgi:hypothetical protein